MSREVYFQLVDKATRLPLPDTFVDAVDLAENASVIRFRRAVWDQVKPILPSNVIAANLRVYANREAYDEENGQSFGGDLAIGALGASKKGALIVVVPTQRFQQLQRPLLEIPQVDWTMASCSQLVVEDKAELIELPPSCVDGTGIGRSGGPLMLYRRPSLVKQWNEMDRCSIQTYALLWIVGPPGTGKSCTALAFACALDRAYWDVLWIHYSRRYEYFNCVRLHGNMKAVCVIKEETIDRDLPAILNGTSQERQTIVFLDGYVKSSKAGEAARLKCKRWHQENEIQHRLVCICSMATLGKDFRAADYPIIPTRIDYRQRSTTSAGVEMQPSEDNDDIEMHPAEEDEDVDYEMMFKVDSWRLEEYADAISNTEFFNRIVDVFPSSNNALGEREKLLEAKYIVAGESARLMFDVSTEKAIRILDDAIDAATDVELYLQGHVGDASATAVNRLLARYPSSAGPDIRLVSSYVVRRIAVNLGPRLLVNFAKACVVNPSMDGHILEACFFFFAELSHKGLDWSYWEESTMKRDRWEQSDVVFFDPDKYKVSVSLDDPTWMAPVKWNQGGYDAVFVNKRENLVRFVQVTRAEKHTFDPTYFVALLNKLAAGALKKPGCGG
ncbi:Deoxyribose-phosphate aldolase [Phytophthora nicotianae]|uniref:Deoxyribose-phosphate aldolase n=1 Tax=Phytophthora nicotianae TaxID=4792 RepID=A0A0W8CVB4_PHYNI|nr:Deoxyribose-phosphate aldolase [Phytophthora nicotianae]